jgi:hypothetical protein
MGFRVRTAALLVALVAALAPAAILASDSALPGDAVRLVAQATGTPTRTPTATPTRTATPAATPGAPTTGNAGLFDQSGNIAVVAALAALTIGLVAAIRVTSSQRKAG